MAFAACVLAAAVCPAVSRADPARVTIHVTDARTGNALALAVALLNGPATLRGSSDQVGTVGFGGVLPGTYSLTISEGGYLSSVTQVVIAAGQTIDIKVALGLLPLNVIARVSNSREPSASAVGLSMNSPYTSAFDTLLDAVGTLPGANYMNGPPSRFTLDGRGAAQAGLDLDGIPLGPGGSSALNGLDDNVFSGVSLDHGFDGGNSGGALDFSAPDPTINWIGTLWSGVGSRGRNTEEISERGSLGRLGIAAVVGSRQDYDEHSGETSLDSSGTTYSRAFALAQTTAVTRLRYPTSLFNTLTFTNVQSNGSYAPSCNVRFGSVPCGYGPGNLVASTASSTRLNDAGAIGRFTLSGTLFSNVGSTDTDLSNRTVAGSAFPFQDLNRYRQAGYQIKSDWSAPSGNDGLEASVMSYTTTVQERQSALQPFSFGSNSYFEAIVSASQHGSKRLSTRFDEFIGSQRFEGTTASTYAGAAVTQRFENASVFEVRGVLGESAFGLPPGAGITSPDSLLYDCDGGYAFGVASSGLGGPKPSSSQVSATWSAPPGAQDFSAHVYVERDQSIPLLATVAGSSLSPAVFPAGYFAEVNALAASSDICGRPTSFSPASTIYTFGVTGDLLLRGVWLSDLVHFKNHAALYVYAGVQGARVLTEDAAGATPYSTLRVGAQLPGVPLYSGAAQFSANLTPNSTLVAGFHAVSGNNANNLPGFVTADANVSYRLARGILQFSAQNIFGTYSDPFPPFSLGVRQDATNGVALPALPHPLSGQTSVSTISWGLAHQTPRRR